MKIGDFTANTNKKGEFSFKNIPLQEIISSLLNMLCATIILKMWESTGNLHLAITHGTSYR
ncbi:hypothetical protein [Chryseobacterium indoltheticum]|uniref:hypothetical protein n=1 Tax=Chryseobacterium indoltheticum TaxID=254 RepID=UPI003F49938C